MRLFKNISFIFLIVFIVIQPGCICAVLGGKRTLPKNAMGDVKSQPNDVSGLYTGEMWKYSFVPNISAPGGGSWQYQVVRRRYLFLPDNRVYRGTPAGGLDRFNYDNACKNGNENCGKYVISRNKINIVWGDDRKEELNVTNYTTLQAGGITVNRVDKYKELRLEGEWGYTNYVAVTSPGDNKPNQTTVSSDKTLKLTLDGRFAASNFTGFVTSGDEANGASSGTTSGEGKYEINDNTLTLKFSDGRTGHYNFWIHPNDSNVIVVDGVTYITR